MIRLRALGVLDLAKSEGDQIRQVLAQPKRAALLTYLALATPRGSHPRDKLVALFWPDQASEQARNALSQAVHFLRRALGDDVIVSHNGDSLSVAPSLLWCDAIAFDDAIRQGRVEEALELYRGDFLEGFHVANAPDFERWLDSERQRLAAEFDALLEMMATRSEQHGDLGAAVTYRRRLAARSPYNSMIALRLMRTLAASGDPAAAVQHARVHETLVRSELDIALPAEITAFVTELQSRPAVQPVVPVPPVVGHPIAEPIVETNRPSARTARRAWKMSRRVAMLTAALVTVSGVAMALVVSSRDSTSDEVRSLYLAGRSAEVNRSQVMLETAAQHYRQALERDSGFALGYAALSQTYTLMGFYDFAPRVTALDSARILAHRAVELDSTLSETRAALAMSLANSGHFPEAEREFSRAIELDPTNAEARIGYGMLLIALGRAKEALAEVELALKLNPLAPRVAHGVRNQATYLMTGRRPQLDLPPPERRPILQVQPGEPWARAQTAVELADEGRCAEARSDISLAQRLVQDGNRPMLAFIGAVHSSCGEKERARALLAQMKQRPDVNDHALRVAIFHTELGELDSAFVWLQRQQWMVAELAMLRAAPRLDPLRSDPEFPRLLHRLGLR